MSNLHESEKRLELALEGGDMGFWDVDLPTGITVVNNRWAEILGYSLAELMPVTQEKWLSTIHPDDLNRVLEIGSAHRQGETAMYEMEYRVKTKSGQTRWVLSKGAIFERDKDDAPIRMVGTVLDITDNKKLEEELLFAMEAAKAANKAKSLFLANMSHELRTPLNAIIGFSRILAEDTTVNNDQQKTLSIINRSSEHLLAMINDVLDLSKIEAGKIEINPESFDIVHLFEDIGAMFQGRISSNGITFDLEIDKIAVRYVRSDAGKLRQILINLLGNAVKFTDEGGIALRARTQTKSGQDGIYLLVEVEDSGIGISKEKIKTIFQPFTQAENLRAGQKGTGLGLSISQSFVTIMEGTLTVESQAGAGSMFRLELPLALCDTNDIAPRNDITEPTIIGLEDSQTDWRILITDDDTQNRLLLKMLLERVGFTTREAVNGAEAVERF